MSANEWNQPIIEEFRANEGRVGGMFEHLPLLLLHTTGAKSGAERINPLAYRRLGDDSVAVFGSYGGSPKHPDWYHNVVANPDVKVEIGTDNYSAKARVATGDEYKRIWEQQKRDFAQFAEYEGKTDGRQIPVVVVEKT
jgi:deazaflavin-dependent oxidoreductase (nitroreductase family)